MKADSTSALEYAHPDYPDACDEWRTIQDALEGSNAVKRAGIRYLPKLSDQDDNDYKAFKKRADFFNATKRTKEALSGLLMRKPPEIAHQEGEQFEAQFADFTNDGMSILHWVKKTSEAMVSTGRQVSIIDWNDDLDRPYVATYHACDVLNWATEMINGKRMLTLLIVREQEECCTDMKVEKQYRNRCYQLKDGVVTCREWIDGDDKNSADPENIEPTELKRKGKPLPSIPAVFHNANHLGCEIGEAPLYDIAELNMSHYRTSADLENGLHIAGLPTPYATGVNANSSDLTLGASKAWTSEDPNAKFGFIEFTGAGLSELTGALDKKEKQMAVLGARLLFNESKDAEAFETVKLRAVSETASLANIAGHMSVTCTQVLQWFIWWAGTAEDPTDIDASITINQDFVDTTITPQMFTALVQAFAQGMMSFDAFFHQLKQGEIYPADWDMEQEAAAIAQRPPSVTPPGNNTPPDTE